MIFPKKLFRSLTSLWRSLERWSHKTGNEQAAIPDIIGSNEILVRGVYYPNDFKKNSISDRLFLPSSGQKHVSLLRHDFTTDVFCKSYFAGIPSNRFYKGLFPFVARHFYELAHKHNLNDEVELVVSPIDENNQPITQRPIPSNATGAPMHADLVYKHSFTPGQPQTNYREFSRSLIKIANSYLEDPHASSITWDGPPIKSLSLSNRR